MKQQFIFSIVLFAVFVNHAHGQQPVDSNKQDKLPAYTLSKTILGTYNYINVDKLNQIYLISTGNQLKKMNSNGDSVAVYNDVRKYGNPGYIDASNPLKILVYYPNFSSIVSLDRLLAQRFVINLRKQQIFAVKAVATSYDNNIWVFDEQDYKLKKISEEGALLFESADLRQLIAEAPAPTQIMDADNFVYLYDPQKGFYIFDYYGGLKNHLPLKNWEHVAVINKTLIGISEGHLITYELETLRLKSYTIPSEISSYEMIRFVNGSLYLLKKDRVEIYLTR